ncbi:hypothetical protein [Halobacillus mangrovi]
MNEQKLRITFSTVWLPFMFIKPTVMMHKVMRLIQSVLVWNPDFMKSIR